jgi:hypothetical protein
VLDSRPWPDPLQDDLRQHVMRLASEIGPRNIYHYEGLQQAAAYCETSLPWRLSDAGRRTLWHHSSPAGIRPVHKSLRRGKASQMYRA